MFIYSNIVLKKAKATYLRGRLNLEARQYIIMNSCYIIAYANALGYSMYDTMTCSFVTYDEQEDNGRYQKQRRKKETEKKETERKRKERKGMEKDG